MFWEFFWQWELKWAEWGAGTEQSTPGEALVAMGPGRWCALVPVSELSTPSGSSWSGDESNHLPCKELSFLSSGADLGLCLNSTAISVGHMLCKKRYSEERAAWKAGICELWGGHFKGLGSLWWWGRTLSWGPLPGTPMPGYACLDWSLDTAVRTLLTAFNRKPWTLVRWLMHKG